MIDAIWTAMGVVAAALIAYLGTRYTVNQASKAQKRMEAMGNKAVDAAAYERARESYEAAIANYLAEIDRLQGRVDALNRRISALNQDVESLDQARREQRFEIEATIEQLIEVRNAYEDHLHRCEQRLGRIRKRLLDGTVDITDHDADLLLDP